MSSEKKTSIRNSTMEAWSKANRTLTGRIRLLALCTRVLWFSLPAVILVSSTSPVSAIDV